VLEEAFGVVVEIPGISAMMCMGHQATQTLPEPFDGIGFGIVRRREDEAEGITVARQGLTDELGASRGMDAGIISEDERHPPSRLGPGDQVVELLTEQVGGAGEAEADGGPAIPPIDRTKRNEANILAGSRDEALSPMSFATPEAGQRRMKMDVHFILDVEVCPWEQGQQVRHIRGQKG